MDAIGLFTNIKHDEGLDTLKQELNKREKRDVPTDYLVKMMEIILKKKTYLSSMKAYIDKT